MNEQLSESPRVSTVPSSLPEEIEYTYAMSSKADEEVAMTLNFLQQNCMQLQKIQGDLQQKTTRIHQLETELKVLKAADTHHTAANLHSAEERIAASTRAYTALETR